MAVLSLLSVFKALQQQSWKKPFHDECLTVQVPPNLKCKGTFADGQCQLASSGWWELILQTAAFLLHVRFLQVMHIAFAPVYVARSKGIQRGVQMTFLCF